MLAIRLPKEIEDRLERLAKKTGRTKTYYAREAILEYIEDMEDHYLAESRLSKGLPGIPLEEVERRLDLED
jgi:RHH-type rel operon transcriptional repressor/antitoxin RelB